MPKEQYIAIRTFDHRAYFSRRDREAIVSSSFSRRNEAVGIARHDVIYMGILPATVHRKLHPVVFGGLCVL
jgi:hypothetical protein